MGWREGQKGEKKVMDKRKKSNQVKNEKEEGEGTGKRKRKLVE
jgi:hypothetical protein